MFRRLDSARWPVPASILALLVLVGAACTGEGEPTSSPSPGDPTPTASDVELGATCTNPQLGYEVAHVQDWEVNDGDVLPTCSLFDPESVDVEEGTEIPTSIAIVLRGADAPFDRVVDQEQVDPGIEVLERTETTVDGRDAVSIRFEATQDAPLLDPGTRGYRYTIDLGGLEPSAGAETLLAVTYDTGEPDFDRKQRVLDAMVDSLRFTAGPGASPGKALGGDLALVLGRSSQLAGPGVIDVRSGAVIRELPGNVGEGASSLDYVAGRNAALFARAVTGARSEVVQVPLDGSAEPHVLDVGYAVDATDDGDRIAVARRLRPDDDQRTIELEVRVDDEVLGTWTTQSSSELPAEPANLAWSPDGTQLAFDVRFEDGVSTFLIDVAEAPEIGELFDVARAIEPREQEGAMASRPFWLPDGSFGLVLGCCELPGFDTWTAVLVDPQTEEVTETLFEVERGIGAIDVHTEQRRVLAVLSHDVFGDREQAEPDELVIWESGNPVPVAGQLQDAAW